MVIVKEKTALVEDAESLERLSVQSFDKLVGKKTRCQATCKSKNGLTSIQASPPAFCGCNQGSFYLTTGRGDLSVSFTLRAMASITRVHFDDGSVDEYNLLLTDGTRITLNLLG